MKEEMGIKKVVYENRLLKEQVEKIHSFGECWIRDYDRTSRSHWEKALYLWASDRRVVWQKSAAVPVGLDPGDLAPSTFRFLAVVDEVEWSKPWGGDVQGNATVILIDPKGGEARVRIPCASFAEELEACTRYLVEIKFRGMADDEDFRKTCEVAEAKEKGKV